MSRVGKKIIEIPKDVSITLQDDIIRVKGTHGTLEKSVKNIVQILIEGNQLSIKRLNEEKTTRAYHGLIRALIQNMVTGVHEKFTRTLIAEGVGYKFQVDNNSLAVSAGFSHPVNFGIPSDLTVKAEGATRIAISGIDKEQVGFFASQVRGMRPPEPYKGKGIRYDGEVIMRKEGKTGK
jgi:large subunit ribosomal protein L6